MTTFGDPAVTDTEVPALGVAHVPSPRQYVELDAPVPPFRFPTGRLPVTPVVSGSPVAFVSVSDSGVPSAFDAPDSVTSPDNAHGLELVNVPFVPPVSVAAPEDEPSRMREPMTLLV